MGRVKVDPVSIKESPSSLSHEVNERPMANIQHTLNNKLLIFKIFLSILFFIYGVNKNVGYNLIETVALNDRPGIG